MGMVQIPENSNTDKYTLDSLIADLKKSTYTPRTQEEMKQAADNRYQSLYDQKKLEAAQANETNQLALDRQLSSMGTTYAKQKEASAKDYANAYSQANRQATSRGMQRSSFNNATLGNIAVAGNKAQQEIEDQEAIARTGIEDQKTLLARQLASQLQQYSASQAADTLAYLDELEQKEYDRTTSANDKSNALATQIYQFANQEKQQDQQAQQWLQEFNENIRQYDSNLAEESRQYNQNFTEQQRQYNETLAEQKRGTDLQNQYNYDQLAQQQAQFQKEMDEDTRQFEKSLTEQQRQYDLSTAEGKRQFDASLSMDQKRLLEEIRQYDASMAENQRQFDRLHPAKKTTTTKTTPPPGGGGTDINTTNTPGLTLDLGSLIQSGAKFITDLYKNTQQTIHTPLYDSKPRSGR